MQAERGFGFDWRDGAAYAPLLGADRSLFAWEWLRRDRFYRAAAEAALEPACERREAPEAAAFGLLTFEDPHLCVPLARPLWRTDAHPLVLQVERCGGARADDEFDLRPMRDIATLVAREHREHLLLSDGLRAVRLDGPTGVFGAGPACLRYMVEGLASAEAGLLMLRRFLALCRRGHFSRSLHPREPRARRWILMLRAFDGLAAGADQRAIAAQLLSDRAAEPCWRVNSPSLRSQAQRLVQSARSMAAGAFRELLK